MEDVPDQDSARNPEKCSTFILPTRARPVASLHEPAPKELPKDPQNTIHHSLKSLNPHPYTKGLHPMPSQSCPGLGLEKIRQLLVYTISLVYANWSNMQQNISPRGRGMPPWGVPKSRIVCVCYIFEQCAYTPGNCFHQPFSDFF